MDQNCALLTAGIVFGLVALLHALRLLIRFDVVMAGKRIPLWVNAIGFVIALGLSIWMLMVRT